MSILDTIKQDVVEGNYTAVPELVKQALAEGVPAEQILNAGLIAGMSEVGRLFGCGEYFVPEMLVAALGMKKGLEVLRPALVAANVQALGKIVIGTVKGDLHDIGKNLVVMMMEGAGLQVIDLGVDVTPDKFVAAVREHQPQLVGMSALLTTTMPGMKSTIDALKSAGLRDQVKVLIGGAPVTDTFAHEIGADVYASNASAAAAGAQEALAQMRS